MNWIVRDWRLGLLGVYAIVVLAIMIDVGEPDQGWWWAAMVPFLLYGIAPVALLCLTRAAPLAKAIGALVIGGVGLWLYIDTMYLAGPDAQSGIIFVILPALQLAAAFGWLILLWLYARFAGGNSGQDTGKNVGETE